MMPSFADALAPDRWPALVIVGARFSGLMMVDPLWVGIPVPTKLRAALVALFTIAVLPGVGSIPLPGNVAGLIAPIASEMLLGAAIGLVAAIFLAGVTLGGEVATIQMGLNLTAAVTGMADGAIGGIGEVERRFATTIYVAIGGPLVMLAGVAHSLITIPPGSVIALAGGGQAIMTMASTVFSTAVHIAAPMLVTLLLANLALGVLARAVPQLQGFAAAFPITIGIGFLVCGATLPFIAHAVGSWADTLPNGVAAMIDAFASVGH
jgi:flagellar biosynthetic protein FliR